MNVEQHEWIYFRSRELSLLDASLIAESFKSCLNRVVIKDYVKAWFHNSFYCGKGHQIRAYRKKADMKRAAKLLKQALNPRVLESLFELALEERETAEKRIKEIESSFSSNAELKTLYSDIRMAFINFFPLQALPIPIEHSFEELGDESLFEKYGDTLAEWRKNTHRTEMRVEELLLRFLEKASLGFKCWTDEEVNNYFATGAVPSQAELAEREKGYVLVWKMDKTPAYELIAGLEARKIHDSLKETTRVAGEVKGTPVTKGKARGTVHLVKSKEDFRDIPPGSIVVASAVELADVNLLKSQEISGIITEEGGITSHIAILGREFKIPIIMSAKAATEKLKAREQIEMDAGRGTVRKVA